MRKNNNFWFSVEKTIKKLITWRKWDKPVIENGVVMPYSLSKKRKHAKK